jgi:beta-N-acetylhexosaminidase
MVGLTATMPRKDYIPGVIAAGCDMILFFNDPAEDIDYIRQALRKGTISKERLDDAVLRILGLKAKLGLNNMKFPEKEGLSVVGCDEHHKKAEMAADESITLVKDTQNILPLDPSTKKNLRLYFIESAPVSLLNGADKAKAMLVKELEDAGFNVTAPKDYYELEMEKQSPFNKFRVMGHEGREQFKENTDVVLFVVNMKGYAQTNNVRLCYDASHSAQNPWFAGEVPTIAVSLNYTNHLYDIPMMKTYINAYGDSKEYLHALVEKLTGKSEFKGIANDLVWCGRWDTRL